MPDIERMTITMPGDLSAFVKSVVESGDYATTSEVIREAVRDLKAKRRVQAAELETLRAEIRKGLDDLDAGRMRDVDAKEIVKRGRKLLATRAPSA